MERNITTQSRFSYYDYIFEKTTVRYVLMHEEKQMFLLLLPTGMEKKQCAYFDTRRMEENGFVNCLDWYPGCLVHLHLSQHMTPMYENSLKFSQTVKQLRFDSQEVEENTHSQKICTLLRAEEGYSVRHELIHISGENGFEVNCTFYNETGRPVTLEMISSASLDNLSPFCSDDGSKSLCVHYFKAGWAIEGKHISRSLSDLNMEKSWGGSFECEKIYSLGSKSVGRYHPYVALEDREAQCTWGIKLKHNASWQIELSRYGTPLSLSAGISDAQTGAWQKVIPNGGSFQTPSALVAVARGGIAEVSNDLIEMSTRSLPKTQGAELPIVFNNWGLHWGSATESQLLSVAAHLKGSRAKYFVIDDGWQSGRAGDWEVNSAVYPQGLRHVADALRREGLIPGLWIELEAVNSQARRFEAQYDANYLHKAGAPLIHACMNSNPTKFLDMRKAEVRDELDRRILPLLKENHIGYLKIDYNSNIGIGCDGEESPGENLRQQMAAAAEYLRHLRREIPGIVIESCASGGGRLDALTMGLSDLSSFSDAIECKEVPLVAAGLHYLIPPQQSLIWCMLKPEYSRSRTLYSIAAGFLGRICWTGAIDRLRPEQKEWMLAAEKLYDRCADLIREGRSYVYRTDTVNYRYPTGTQALIRYSSDRGRALAVCHFFDAPKTLTLPIGEYEMEGALAENGCRCEDGLLSLVGEAFSANVLLLRARTGK